MGGSLYLMASTAFGSGLTPSGVYWVPKKTTTFGLNNTLIKTKLNAHFPCAFHCLIQHSVMCFFIAKYLYIISHSYGTPAVLICLFSLLLEDVRTHPQPKSFSQQFVPLQVCVEGYHEWWCCIMLHIPTSLFYIYFWKQIVKPHNFGINCIFSYYCLTIQCSLYVYQLCLVFFHLI